MTHLRSATSCVHFVRTRVQNVRSIATPAPLGDAVGTTTSALAFGAGALSFGEVTTKYVPTPTPTSPSPIPTFAIHAEVRDLSFKLTPFAVQALFGHSASLSLCCENARTPKMPPTMSATAPAPPTTNPSVR